MMAKRAARLFRGHTLLADLDLRSKMASAVELELTGRAVRHRIERVRALEVGRCVRFRDLGVLRCVDQTMRAHQAQASGRSLVKPAPMPTPQPLPKQGTAWPTGGGCGNPDEGTSIEIAACGS
jgi:hypothetical protein